MGDISMGNRQGTVKKYYRRSLHQSGTLRKRVCTEEVCEIDLAEFVNSLILLIISLIKQADVSLYFRTFLGESIDSFQNSVKVSVNYKVSEWVMMVKKSLHFYKCTYLWSHSKKRKVFCEWFKLFNELSTIPRFILFYFLARNRHVNSENWYYLVSF